MPAGSGRHGAKAGDLLVRVDVQVPRQLTPDQRAAVEALAATGHHQRRRPTPHAGRRAEAGDHDLTASRGAARPGRGT